MNNNLYFHIHYCNSRHVNEPGKHLDKMIRTLGHHELILCTGGHGSIEIGQKKHAFKEGTLFYIGPDMPHCIEKDEGPAGFMSVHFSCALVHFQDGKWAIDELKKLSLESAMVIKEYHTLAESFKKMAETWREKQPGYEFITRTQLQQLITAIYQNRHKQNQNYGAGLKVEKVIGYMHENVDKKMTLMELAQLAGYSPFYLSRAFKSTTGYSVIAYFNRIKMDKAKELMIEGTGRVKEVARALGFADEFYFSRLFKHTEGISPSEYYSRIVHGV